MLCVRGCVGGVAMLLILLHQRCKKSVRGSIFPDLCRRLYTNNATGGHGPGPPQLRWLRRLDVSIGSAAPPAEPVTEARKDQWNQRVSAVLLKCTRSQKKWGQVKVIHRLSTGFPQTRMTVYDIILRHPNENHSHLYSLHHHRYPIGYVTA